MDEFSLEQLLLDQQTYSEKSENIICLDPYILNSFCYLDPISNHVSQCMTSLLKLEITGSFLAFIASLSGSLKRID